MSLETNISDLATRIASELKAHKTLINNNAADLSGLLTTNKANLVAAINELVGAIGGAGATIDDDNISTLTVWSSDKTNEEIDTQVSAAIDDLVAAAPGALDTLNELAAALGDDPNFATTITNELATKANDADVVKLAGTQTITGAKTFSVAPGVPDASFVIAKITGLQTALDAKAPLLSPALTGTPTAPTATAGTSTTQVATTAFVQTANPAASSTVAGKVELATDSEAVAGTDTARAVTPANLAAVVGDSTENFVTTFEAGLV